MGLGLSLPASMQEGGEWERRGLFGKPPDCDSVPEKPKQEMNWSWRCWYCCCSSSFKMSFTEKGVVGEDINGLGSIITADGSDRREQKTILSAA